MKIRLRPRILVGGASSPDAPSEAQPIGAGSPSHEDSGQGPGFLSTRLPRKLWLGLIVLAVLSPLGLLLPAWFGAGSAWGEWSAEELKGLVGYAPAQLERLGSLWHAPLPDYAGPGTSPLVQSVWYVISALVGLGLVVGLSLLLGRWLARNEQSADVDN